MSNEFTGIDLDTDLDDIEDLPSFTVYPTGAYAVTVLKAEQVKIKDKDTYVQVDVGLQNILEMTETLSATEEPPKEGDIQSFLFDLSNKTGSSVLKQFFENIKKHTGTKSVGETMKASIGLTLVIIQSRTYNKEKDRHYPKIVKVDVA
jgi:uncharacterized protein (UPF0212 family)